MKQVFQSFLQKIITLSNLLHCPVFPASVGEVRLIFQNFKQITVSQKRLFFCCVNLSTFHKNQIPSYQMAHLKTAFLKCNEVMRSEGQLRKSGLGPAKVSWSWAVLPARGRKLHMLWSLSPHLRPLRGHVQERETGDQPACQRHSGTQKRTQEVTSSSQKGDRWVNLPHTLHLGVRGYVSQTHTDLILQKKKNIGKGQRQQTSKHCSTHPLTPGSFFRPCDLFSLLFCHQVTFSHSSGH